MSFDPNARCEGGHPEFKVCGMRDTCALYLQLARDKTADPKTWVGTPVIPHCHGATHNGQLPGYVRDDQAYRDQVNTWQGQRRNLGRIRTETLRQKMRESR